MLRLVIQRNDKEIIKKDSRKDEKTYQMYTKFQPKVTQNVAKKHVNAHIHVCQVILDKIDMFASSRKGKNQRVDYVSEDSDDEEYGIKKITVKKEKSPGSSNNNNNRIALPTFDSMKPKAKVPTALETDYAVLDIVEQKQKRVRSAPIDDQESAYLLLCISQQKSEDNIVKDYSKYLPDHPARSPASIKIQLKKAKEKMGEVLNLGLQKELESCGMALCAFVLTLVY